MLALWVPLMIGLGAYLAAAHEALPSSEETRIQRAIVDARRPDAPPIVLHFLYGECTCSSAILEHLVARGPRAGYDERVVLIDGVLGEADRARAAGFPTEALSAEAVEAKYGVEAAPLLVVANRTNDIVYDGGYTATSASPVLRDDAILARTERGERVPSLPIFGCAVSTRLQRARDPLALRR